ncbi:MAG: hypothetical protein JW885_09770 [Deltaproteobacteria bacterium]|nr:hypothetical protein [Candidatus Zymogenaceae bacterium]
MELLALGAGVLFLLVLGVVVVATMVSAFFIWIGAKISGVENATFMKSFWAALVSSVLIWVLAAVINAPGWIIGLLVSLVVIKAIFKTTWGKALLTWIFHGVVQFVLLIIVVLILVGMGVAVGALLLI